MDELLATANRLIITSLKDLGNDITLKLTREIAVKMETITKQREISRERYSGVEFFFSKASSYYGI